ncbi:MAG: LacI family DNA-binding transcriptional regulator [Thiolinea sp.]
MKLPASSIATAGVSTATVSRTLSQPEQVSEETRERVMAAVKKTGYRINRSARNLRKQQSGEVLIRSPIWATRFSRKSWPGLKKPSAGSEYNVLIADSRDHPGGRELLAEHLEHTRADGIIILMAACRSVRSTGYKSRRHRRTGSWYLP